MAFSSHISLWWVPGTQGLWPTVYLSQELESILMPQWCPGTRTSSPGLIQGLPHIRGYSGCTKHHHCLPMSLSWTRLRRDLPPSPVRAGNEGWRRKGQLSHSSHCQTLPACGYFTRHCMVSQSCEGWDLPGRGSKSHQWCPCPGKPSCSERCPFGCCSPQLPTNCRVPKPTHALWLLPEEADEPQPEGTSSASSGQGQGQP